jgi:hypothetical protein
MFGRHRGNFGRVGGDDAVVCDAGFADTLPDPEDQREAAEEAEGLPGEARCSQTSWDDGERPHSSRTCALPATTVTSEKCSDAARTRQRAELDEVCFAGHIRGMRRIQTIVLAAFALGASSCLDVVDEELAPIDAPGDKLGAITGCTSSFCLAWSGDSKVLFAVSAGALVAVNPETRIVTTIATLGGMTSLRSNHSGDHLYFTRTEGTTTAGLIEIVTATGVQRRIAGIAATDFAISQGGSAVAFHPQGTTATADTVVVLDLASGTRRGKLATPRVQILAVSATGDQVLVVGTATGSEGVRLWTPATNALDVAAIPPSLALEGAAWVGDRFRLLIRTGGRLASVDRRIADTVLYHMSVLNPLSISWVPERDAAFAALPGKCYETEGIGTGCSLTVFALTYATAGEKLEPGTVNVSTAAPSILLRASPDAVWLAHRSYPQGVFLLRNTTP